MKKRLTVRQHIVKHIAENIGWRLGNIKRGTATEIDKQLVDEALGFRCLCLSSCIDDSLLKKCWDNSNLEYSL